MTLLAGFLRSLFIHRETLILENLALRQQLATYKRTGMHQRHFGLETESRLGLRGHEWGNPGYGQDLNLTDHRASPRPYRPARD